VERSIHEKLCVDDLKPDITLAFFANEVMHKCLCEKSEWSTILAEAMKMEKEHKVRENHERD